jgi:dihydropteroate synthase
MGILNITPDSFFDGGRHATPEAAVDRAARMITDGADLVDVGGESTRPGADPVSEAEETDRVVPVVQALRRRFPVRISIDTMKAAVARRALEAGADLVNDVSALRDPGMLQVVCDHDAPLVLMHMRGEPRTMQRETGYDDLIGSVIGFLEDCVESAVAGGVADDKILVDPGIGFGKSAAGSLSILEALPRLGRIGRPILVGSSRKSFIGTALGLPVDRRLEASLAVAAYASAQGAHVVRVHDVAATVPAVRMIDAIRDATRSGGTVEGLNEAGGGGP